MPLITTSPTDVTVINGLPAHSPIDIKLIINGKVVELNNYGLIVTSITQRLASNRQVIPSLDAFVFIYAFGPLPQRIVLSGLLCRNECSGNNLIKKDPLYMLDYLSTYQVHKYIDPIILEIDEYQVPCFLDQIEYTFRHPDSRIGGFSLLFTGLPG